MADRTEGRPGPGDLDRGHRRPACAQNREDRRGGYKARIVIEPDTGLVTAAAVTRCTGEGAADAEAGAVLLEQDPTTAGEVQVLADPAYGTGHTA